eukprot:5002715-Amphidinium_carterae.1
MIGLTQWPWADDSPRLCTATHLRQTLEASQCAVGVRSLQSAHVFLSPRLAQLRVHSCAARGMNTSGTSALHDGPPLRAGPRSLWTCWSAWHEVGSGRLADDHVLLPLRGC